MGKLERGWGVGKFVESGHKYASSIVQRIFPPPPPPPLLENNSTNGLRGFPNARNLLLFGIFHNVLPVTPPPLISHKCAVKEFLSTTKCTTLAQTT